MSKIGLKVVENDRYPSELAEDSRNVSLWSLWALYAAEEALQWPIDELAKEMVARPEYARKIREIFKMLLLERKFEALRARVAEEVIGHIRAALVKGGCDASESLLDAPIEFGEVPGYYGVEAWEVNCLRPQVRAD